MSPPTSIPTDTADGLADQVPPSSSRAGLKDEFVAMYRDLIRFIAKRSGDDDAQDLAHDTWLRIAELEQGRDPLAPLSSCAYLFTVAHHLTVDHLRRRRLASQLAAPTVPLEPDVADAVMYRQAVDAVEAALESLPSRARDVFLQHRLMAVGQVELAERYGLSRNMIERDVMLAMDKVQAALEQWRGEHAEPRKGRRRSLAMLLGMSSAVTVGVGAWQAWLAWVPQWQIALSTRRGQVLRQALPDGSELMLDAQSQAQFRFFAASRDVRLIAGAAFFSVTPDRERPFVVDTDLARVTVLGTRFSVELSGGAVEVQVVEARSELTRGARAELTHP